MACVPRPHGQAAQARPSQTRLLAHSDGDVVVPVVFGDQRHHRPVQGRIGGVDGDKFFRAVLGEPVHLNGVAHSIGEEEHFNLRTRAESCAEGSRQARCGSPPAPAPSLGQLEARPPSNLSSSVQARPPAFSTHLSHISRPTKVG